MTTSKKTIRLFAFFGTTILIVSQTTRTEKKQRNQTLQLRG